MKKTTWGRTILWSGLIFQIIFLFELFFLYEFIIVNPEIHKISYENWGWLVHEWTPPVYRRDYFLPILTAARVLNTVFQGLFGIFIIYLFLRRKQFSFSGRSIVLPVIALTLVHLALRFYIMYHVDFYRLYMDALYPEMLALYMIYCGRRLRISQ